MHRSNHQENRLEFHTEQLESRQMLAGNVNVVARHGDVVVTGDNGANDVLIYDAGGDDIYVVGRNGTTINDRSFTVVTLSDDLKINLKHGNNKIELGTQSGTALNVADDLTIRTGHGADTLLTSNLSVRDDLKVSLGGGSNSVRDDTVGFNYYTVWDDARITSSGRLGMDVEWTVVGDLKVSSGHQADTIIFRGYANQDLSISTRGGDDYIGIAEALVAGDLKVSTHGGDDLFQFVESTIGEDFRLSMSHGFDTAYLFGVNAQMSGVEDLN